MTAKSTSPNRIATLLVILISCAVVGGMGFAIGRSSVSSQEMGHNPAVPPTQPPTETPTITPTITPIHLTATPVTITLDAKTDANTAFDPEDLDLFWEVWDIVHEEFNGELPTDDALLYAMLRGAMNSLDDPYSVFFDPEAAAYMQAGLEGSFEGIGAFVKMNDRNMFEITRPMDGQPADLAGLKAGDIVLAVDDESIAGLSIDEILTRVRGPRDTQVTLTILRSTENDPFDVMITRAHIEIPVIITDPEIEDIAYIRLTGFGTNATEQLADTLAQQLKNNPQGIILDLRDNPGGYLSQAVSVSDLFVPNGRVVTQRDSRGNEDLFNAKNGDIGETQPLVVLVNEGSASASEIVAGAIQDYERGIIIGQQTFGKGSVQQIYTFDNGSEMRLTIAKWYTPNGRSIQDNGITPDIEVETPDSLGDENDAQLQRAIDYIMTGE